MNVTSSLFFYPPAWVPVYGATKAAMHSFTFSLREQLQNTGIGVVEVIPPAVNTDLGGKGMHTYGVDLGLFADCVYEGFRVGLEDVMYPTTLNWPEMSRKELEEKGRRRYRNMIK